MQSDKSKYFYTDTQRSSLSVKIFTIRIYKELTYVNILIDILLQNNKQQFNYWLDPLEFALWEMIEVKGGKLTHNFKLLRSTNIRKMNLTRWG